MVYDMEVPKEITPMNRTRIINSLCAMFNMAHNNSTTPDWLIELHNSSTDDVLIARMENWRNNYPKEFVQHGIYVF